MLLKFVIILVILIITLTIIRIFRCQDLPSSIEILDPKTLKNGDILSKGPGPINLFSAFSMFFNPSVWYHNGIVVIINEKPYIIEFTDRVYNGKRTSKLVFISYEEWVYHHGIKDNNRTCINRLQGPLISADDLLKVYLKYKDCRSETFTFDWIRLISNKPYTGKIRKRYVCYELIIRILQDLNIVQKKKESSSYFASDIVNGKLDMEPEYQYSKPIEINMKQTYKLLTNE
jgi:predicted KAP-like P-loop ATPase